VKKLDCESAPSTNWECSLVLSGANVSLIPAPPPKRDDDHFRSLQNTRNRKQALEKRLFQSQPCRISQKFPPVPRSARPVRRLESCFMDSPGPLSRYNELPDVRPLFIQDRLNAAREASDTS